MTSHHDAACLVQTEVVTVQSCSWPILPLSGVQHVVQLRSLLGAASSD